MATKYQALRALFTLAREQVPFATFLKKYDPLREDAHVSPEVVDYVRTQYDASKAATDIRTRCLLYSYGKCHRGHFKLCHDAVHAFGPPGTPAHAQPDILIVAFLDWAPDTLATIVHEERITLSQWLRADPLPPDAKAFRFFVAPLPPSPSLSTVPAVTISAPLPPSPSPAPNSDSDSVGVAVPHADTLPFFPTVRVLALSSATEREAMTEHVQQYANLIVEFHLVGRAIRAKTASEGILVRHFDALYEGYYHAFFEMPAPSAALHTLYLGSAPVARDRVMLYFLRFVLLHDPATIYTASRDRIPVGPTATPRAPSSSPIEHGFVKAWLDSEHLMLQFELSRAYVFEHQRPLAKLLNGVLARVEEHITLCLDNWPRALLPAWVLILADVHYVKRAWVPVDDPDSTYDFAVPLAVVATLIQDDCPYELSWLPRATGRPHAGTLLVTQDVLLQHVIPHYQRLILHDIATFVYSTSVWVDVAVADQMEANHVAHLAVAMPTNAHLPARESLAWLYARTPAASSIRALHACIPTRALLARGGSRIRNLRADRLRRADAILERDGTQVTPSTPAIAEAAAVLSETALPPLPTTQASGTAYAQVEFLEGAIATQMPDIEDLISHAEAGGLPACLKHAIEVARRDWIKNADRRTLINSLVDMGYTPEAITGFLVPAGRASEVDYASRCRTIQTQAQSSYNTERRRRGTSMKPGVSLGCKGIQTLTLRQQKSPGRGDPRIFICPYMPAVSSTPTATATRKPRASVDPHRTASLKCATKSPFSARLPYHPLKYIRLAMDATDT